MDVLVLIKRYENDQKERLAVGVGSTVKAKWATARADRRKNAPTKAEAKSVSFGFLPDCEIAYSPSQAILWVVRQ